MGFWTAARALLACLVLISFPAQSQELLDLASFGQSELRIQSQRGEQRFSIWIASTWQQQSQGLMFVRDLPADRGMLFIHDRPKPLRMWMKNTYIPLDMLFIDGRGRIIRIAAMTEPFSLAEIASGGAAKAVLEIRGGEAAKRGIRVGDRVVHASFSRSRL